jgi:putative peptidoglycan lipid II flippase
VLISAVLGVGLFAGADWAIKLIAPGLSPQSTELAAASLRIMGWPLAVQLSGSGLIAAQYALQGQPLIQSTALLYSGAVIGALLFLTPSVGPISAAIGAGASFFLMFVVVVIGTLRLARRPAVVSAEPTPDARNEGSMTLVALASIVLYGQTMVGPLIASLLAEGTVAQLSFAYRPVEVIARGLPVVIAYTVMPALAAAHGRQQSEQAQAQAAEALQVTLLLVLPLAALLVAVREPVVNILYQRAAFSDAAAQAVAPTLAWYAAALPGLSVVVVLETIFFSVGRERSALILGLAILGTFLGFGLVLGLALGGAGVALAFCIANTLGALGGAAAAGHRAPRALIAANWFRWTVLASILGLAGGSLGVASTRGLPSSLQLAAGLILGGIGPVVVLARSQVGRAWLAQRIGRLA